MKNIKLLVATLLVTITASAQFTQKALPYAYNALEPFVDAQTMEIHYSKHHAAYVKNLNTALAGTADEKLSLNEIFAKVSTMTPAVRNNAGGHYNHELFWSVLTPEENTKISAELEKAINETFGSFDVLKEKLNAAGASRFGSGWAWLVVTKEGKLAVTSTSNQDNPLMDIAEVKGTPIFGIDVWEHAYYLKYKNKRADYLTAIWYVINWDEVSKRYKEANVKPDIFAAWPEIKIFHKVMSQTFHPSEEGNLQPIKERSAEMVEKANALKMAKIPAQFNKKEIVVAVNKLAKDSKELDKLVKSKASDDKITKALNGLHDTFHTIVGLCTHDEE
jgi:superoxide dismutase